MMPLVGMFNSRWFLPAALLVVAGGSLLRSSGLYAADLNVADPGESVGNQQQELTPVGSRDNAQTQQQLLPPPPPGPYQSMAFERERSESSRFRRSVTDVYSRTARPVPTRTPAPGAMQYQSYPYEQARQQARERAIEAARTRAEQQMNMFSPDRPWPDDLRPAQPRNAEQGLPRNEYQSPRAAVGSVSPYYRNDGGNFSGGNYMPEPVYDAPVPPGYWPDMNSRAGNPSYMNGMPIKDNSTGDSAIYPESPQGRQR